MIKRLQINIYNVISRKPAKILSAKIFHTFIISLIVMNIFVVILDTVEDFNTQYGIYSHYFELFSVIVFTIEYLLRVFVCVVSKQYRTEYGRLRYMKSALAIIDLLAILPFFIPIFVEDSMILRTFRLFRLFRLFKLGRYSKSYELISKILRKTWHDIGVSMIFIFTAWIIGSSVIYLAEHIAQPTIFSSIPATMWWTIITLTTTGYGDMYPVTVMGKIAGGILAITGVCLFAIPAGIITSAFVHERNEERVICK